MTKLTKAISILCAVVGSIGAVAAIFTIGLAASIECLIGSLLIALIFAALSKILSYLEQIGIAMAKIMDKLEIPINDSDDNK